MEQAENGGTPADRRGKPRKTDGARVWADPGGVLPVVDCRILDMSETGAQVTSVSGGPLPDKFLLQLEADRVIGEAHVVWRNGALVGVRFANR